MRLPYVDNPPKFENESENEIVKRVQARRGERGLIPLDLALLHSPPVADGWYVSQADPALHSTLQRSAPFNIFSKT